MPLANEVPELPDEYLIEIGRVNVRWAILESVLDLNLLKLLGKDVLEGRSLVIFNHMAFPQKLDILGALVYEIEQSDYAGFDTYQSVESLLRQAQEKRNSLIHAKCRYENGQAVISRITARGKLKMSVTPISVADIRAISDLIYKAADELHILVNNALTSPRKRDSS
jgi:hypothetical protein